MAEMVRKILKAINNYRKKRLIKRLRNELAFWGLVTGHLTDQEMEEFVVCVGETVTESGLTVEEAGTMMQEFGEALRVEGGWRQ